MPCRYADDCRMFAYIRDEAVRQDLVTRYCEGPNEKECARYKLQSTGQLVPLDLLPDGNAIAG